MTSIAKFRHLSQCSTPAGHFVVLAIDHRANLLESLNKYAPHPLDDGQFTAFKQEVITHLLPPASAILTDPDYGIGPGITSGAIPGQYGVLAPIEVTDYNTHPSQRPMQLIPGWSVAKIKQTGGSGVKLLLTYHPKAENAASQRDFARQIIDACAEHDIPFFLEPITYALEPGQKQNTQELRQIVVEMAGIFSEMGADILKLQFPVDAEQEPDESIWQAACTEIDNACTVPWALLSGGVDFDTFARQTQIACAAGASGVMVGRAVWAEATQLQGSERTHFLTTTGQQRMQTLSRICAEYARPWQQRTPTPESAPGWYINHS